jgi:hypothetical protein
MPFTGDVTDSNAVRCPARAAAGESPLSFVFFPLPQTSAGSTTCIWTSIMRSVLWSLTGLLQLPPPPVGLGLLQLPRFLHDAGLLVDCRTGTLCLRCRKAARASTTRFPRELRRTKLTSSRCTLVAAVHCYIFSVCVWRRLTRD